MRIIKLYIHEYVRFLCHINFGGENIQLYMNNTLVIALRNSLIKEVFLLTVIPNLQLSRGFRNMGKPLLLDAC